MDAARFSDRVLKYALSQDMFKNGEKVVAGISGGADSMCLLGLLIDWRKTLSLDITVLHVNHGIRGDEALRDEEFVREFCEREKINCRIVRADIPKIAKEQGCTEEEAGRDLRYREFSKLCGQIGCVRIAVAHNMNDNAETVLLNMARGTGLAGLSGIAPVRELKDGIIVVRPLIYTQRTEIEAYLREKGIDHVTDHTNYENDYSRNCVRNLIMPVLKDKVNSASEAHIAELAGEARETERLVSSLAAQVLDEVRINGFRIDAAQLSEYDRLIAKRVIRLLIGEAAGRLKDIERVHIDAVYDLMSGGTGRQVSLPYGLTAVKSYNELEIIRTEKGDPEAYCEPEEGIILDRSQIPCSAEIMLGQGRKLRISLTEFSGSEEFPKNLYTKWFDYDKIKGDITVRTRRSGDYLMVRMNGGLVRKDLGRWFIDNKIPQEERDRLPLLAVGSHVLWVCGYRRDDTCLVDASTACMLVAEME